MRKPNGPVDRRTPGTPEAMNDEITGAESQADGARTDTRYRVIGYNPTVDGEGNLTLYATRSRLDIAPEAILVNAVILKKIAALYCHAEAEQQLELMGIRLANGPGAQGERPRELVSPLVLGGA